MFKFAVVGVAHPHIYHLAHCAQHAGGTAVGLYENDADRLKTGSEKVGTVGFDNLDKLIALKPDVALIGAVPGDRAALVEKLLLGGVPVLVDKPLALTHEALDKIIKASEKTNKAVVVYYPLRVAPTYVAAIRAIKAGRIGKLVRIYSAGPHKLNAAGRPAWHFTREGNGGVLIDIGAHHFDLACFVAGEDPSWISARHANFDNPTHKEFQDFAQAQLVFPSGVMAHIDVDWLNPASMRHFGDTRFWVQGTKGKIEIRAGDIKSAELWNETVAQEELDTTGIVSGDAWTEKLITDLAAGRPSEIPQADIWRASRVSLRAFESAEAGGKPLSM